MKKRILSLILAVGMMTALAACGALPGILPVILPEAAPLRPRVFP